MSVQDFDEGSYLERYPDVAQAVYKGQFESGRAHFDRYGRAEGRVADAILTAERFELDLGSCFETIPSPALATRPPVVIGSDTMPRELGSMLGSLWGTQQPAGAIACHLLDDVIVVGDGLVFDMAGRLCSASAHQTSARQIERAALKVRNYLDDGAGRSIAGTTLLCEKIGIINYGHWLIEMAPIAFLFRERLASDWYLRLPIVDLAASMTAVVRDSIELLGIDPKRIRWGLGDMPQRYQRLVLTRGLSHHGGAYSPIASAALDAMASRVPAAAPRRLWVSRAGALRSMQDEPGLCRALEARGWLIVSPGSLSLRRQIALFKHAEVVAGVCGAGLTNFAFAPASARIIAMVPCRMPDVFFWTLAQMKGQSYTEVRCRQEHQHEGAFNWDGLLLMTTAEALAQLDAILPP